MLKLAVDIGGTFTDLIIYDEASEAMYILKVSTTPKEPEKAVVKALEESACLADLKSIEAIYHATTIATNALIGQIGLETPKTAFVATKGFKDIIEIGRQNRIELYSLAAKRPKPLVDAEDRFEVNERINYAGLIIKPLDGAKTAELAKTLKNGGYDVVAVCLLHSYVNPVHEQKVKKIFVENGFQGLINLSSEVLPEIREYERATTTIANALLTPIISKYLGNLTNRLRRLNINASIYVMQSDGGLLPAQRVQNIPCKIIESGPAAGVIAARHYAQLANIDDVISFDMGGTTAKASLIEEGEIKITTDYEVGGLIHSGRFVKGSGYPIRFPFIDLSEIGAGGGSIVYIDEGGLLKVGPKSAGADPGPACYGRGGIQPTVTDANLILGRLHREHFLGGKMLIREDLAHEAFKSISKSLKLDEDEAAHMALRVVNANMVKCIRVVSTERGVDPRRLAIVAFGGSGPTHVCDLMLELGLKTAIVPLNPGMASAEGLLLAEHAIQLSKTYFKPFDTLDVERINEIVDGLVSDVYIMLADVVRSDEIIFSTSLDLRYSGQSYDIDIKAPLHITPDAIQSLKDRFNQKHEALYGYKRSDLPLTLVNVKVKGVVPSKLKPHKLLEKGDYSAEQARIGRRRIYFDEYVEADIYLREKLQSGDKVVGPAVIHQYDSTTVINPEFVAEVDTSGLLIIRKE
ncbi:MAG: hydantoinase/oxoprolinase family protein [Nitrososphaerales archaeon]